LILGTFVWVSSTKLRWASCILQGVHVHSVQNKRLQGTLPSHLFFLWFPYCFTCRAYLYCKRDLRELSRGSF
uniref:Ovule protein n=1 Tax=Haemonchus placei TaxID=6290 RepID=A0A0N4W0F9_HAEPC